MTQHSWFDSDDVEIRDDGQDSAATDEQRARLQEMMTSADDDLMTYLRKALEAAGESRPPWPKGVAVLVKDALKGSDYEAIRKAQFNLKYRRGEPDADVLVGQVNIVLAAAAVTGFVEPKDDAGKPKLNNGKGIWTKDGKAVTVEGKTLRERIDIIADLPPAVYDFVAGEINRINEDPLGLKPLGRSLKTVS